MDLDLTSNSVNVCIIDYKNVVANKKFNPTVFTLVSF